MEKVTMPIEMKDADNGLGIIVTGRGVITENEYVGSYTRHLTQDRDKLKNYRYNLNDWTAVTKVEVSTKAINQIAQLCSDAMKINPDAVVAHVADKQITFGLSRMWEMLLEKPTWETMVFKSREVAEAWIKKRITERYGLNDLTFS